MKLVRSIFFDDDLGAIMDYMSMLLTTVLINGIVIVSFEKNKMD